MYPNCRTTEWREELNVFVNGHRSSAMRENFVTAVSCGFSSDKVSYGASLITDKVTGVIRL